MWATLKSKQALYFFISEGKSQGTNKMKELKTQIKQCKKLHVYDVEVTHYFLGSQRRG